MPGPVIISAAVAGTVDEAVARTLIARAGGLPGPVCGKNGKHALRSRINGYNNAARHAPWLVLVDLDGDADCAPLLRQNWLPAPAPLLCFRIAVRQVESWLMADAETLARYLGVARSRIAHDPETLPNAKTVMVSVAQRSCRKAIQMVWDFVESVPVASESANYQAAVDWVARVAEALLGTSLDFHGTWFC